MMQAGGSNHDGFSRKALKSFDQGNDVIHFYMIGLSFGIGAWEGNNGGSEEYEEGIRIDEAKGLW